MATTYTQTIEFSVWKEHKCCCCSTVYRYLFKRTMKGEGASPEQAGKNAEKAVSAALENEVDQRPCPECGLYQPDMIAAQRSSRHWWAFWASVPVPALLLILVLTDIVSYSTAGLVAAVCAVPILAWHFLIDAGNPNANREANRKIGRRMAKDGDMWVPEEKQPKQLGDEPVGTGVGGGHYACYAMLGAAILAFLLPTAARALGGMKSNPGWHPDVAGPGDTPYIYLPDKINCIKGYWRGQPRVTVLNAAEVGAVQIVATSKDTTWPQSISVKSSEKSSSPSLWVRLQLPADASLAGKTLEVRIDMPVHFPSLSGGNRYDDRTQNTSNTFKITLSSPRAGGIYKGSFWLGFLGGMALLFAAGCGLPILSNQFRSQANKTRIHVPDNQRVLEDGVPDAVEDAEPIPLAGDDDRPRKRGVRAERDDDDRPRRRRDEDDDDRPRKRRDEY